MHLVQERTMNFNFVKGQVLAISIGRLIVIYGTS